MIIGGTDSPERDSGLRVTLISAAGYALLALVFSRVTAEHGSASLVSFWPAAGLAIAAAYHWGIRALPGIALGAFVGTLLGGQLQFHHVAIFSVAACAQAFVGARSVRWMRSRWGGDRLPPRIAIWLFTCATSGSMLVPAAEVFTRFSGTLGGEELRYLWVLRWAAEATGAVIAAPLTLFWVTARRGTRTNRAFASGLLVVTAIAYMAVIHLWNASWRNGLHESLSMRTSGIQFAIQKHMDLSLESVRATAQLINSEGVISRQEFSRFVLPFFARHPGLRAIEWIARVPGNAKDEFERTIRVQGSKDFRIRSSAIADTPDRGGGEPNDYFPITYIEPLKGNELALGYDISSTPGAIQTLKSAAETGEISLSDPIILVQEKGQQSGVVGYSPIYRDGASPTSIAERKSALIGVVGGVLRVGDLMNVAIGDLELAGIGVRLEDTRSGRSSPLFEVNPHGEAPTSYRDSRLIRLENQTWLLSTFLTEAGVRSSRSPASALFSLGGVFIIGLTTFTILIIAGRSAEIEVLIKLRTEELRKALAVRDDFLLAASHELKTPLTPLRLQVDFLRELIQRQRIEEFAKSIEFKDLLASIGREVERYALLVHDLLDFSRLSSGQLQLQLKDCDLGEIASGVVEFHRRDADRNGCPIQLVTHGDTKGRWDPQRLEQVLTNIISNAIKYGRSKPILVTVEGAPNGARISVLDQGIGIDEKDHGRIFDRFARAVKIENYAGLGLGLFIVKDLVRAHGGRITVQSALGKGSTFIVDLPKAVPESVDA